MLALCVLIFFIFWLAPAPFWLALCAIMYHYDNTGWFWAFFILWLINLFDE